MLTQYIYVFLCLACCVSADAWDDFTNNLATDLAPLISLFGEQITRQCMSELVSTLDDFIFALAPLGVLTAVVSLIRVCGSPTLRAFIGRAQEDPASSEREILSCVSESTAEIFTESGVARITGTPKILEVVINESQGRTGKVAVQKLSEVAGKALPTDLEKDFQLPNLSLNKGIRRRAPFWFYLAAIFGVSLQSGIFIYAALTVSYWPETFLVDGNSVNSYALPMFLIGTCFLTLGMFLCALIVERCSMKNIITLPEESRVYWIQPGNQKEGDLTFPSFVGRTDKSVVFIRSVRHNSPSEILNISEEVALVFVVSLTMVGFVIQFVGIRGLHASVSLAQLGATMVMTLVRTALRAQRMHQGDNMLGDDQEIVSGGGHELDWLIFHVFKIESFRICSCSNFLKQRPFPEPDSVMQNSLESRDALRVLSSSRWDETSVRGLAHKLSQAIQDLIKKSNSWSGGQVSWFDIVIPLEMQKEDNQQVASYYWETRFSTSKDVDVDLLESVLGLYVWSLKKTNPMLARKVSNKFFRGFKLKNKNPHQQRLLYKKWVNDSSILENALSMPTSFLKGCQTFGHLDCHTDSQIPDHTTLVATSADYYTLAVQDIYAHILHSFLGGVLKLNGITEIVGEDRKNYKLTNSGIRLLADSFTIFGLGDERDAMVCILPVLSDLGLLPEITFNSDEIRSHLYNLEKLYDDKMFSMMEWLCSVADIGEVERVLNEYGYLCLRNLMYGDDTLKALALGRITAILTIHGEGQAQNSTPNYLGNILSTPSASWWTNYRNEMYWLSSRILQFQAVSSHSQQVAYNSQQFEAQYSTRFSLKELYDDQQVAVASQSAFLNLWLGLDYGGLISDDSMKSILDWLVGNKYDNILEWLVFQMASGLSPNYSHENLEKMVVYTVAKGYKEATEIIWRQINKFNIRAFIIDDLASEGDVNTLETLLGRDFSANLTAEHENALLRATERKQFSMIKYLLNGGVNVDVQNDRGETALIIATEQGDIESISILLSHNASLDIHDSSEDTALIIAASHGYLSIVKLLINHGANINAIGRRGRTALIAATFAKNLSLVKYLFEHKADIHALMTDQSSVLDVAVAPYGDINGSWTEGRVYLESLGAKQYKGRKYEDF